MAITLGTFTKLDDGAFTGTLKTLNVTANLTIIPVDKQSENSPDHRVYAGNGQRYEVGAAWSQVAKSSGETYLNLKIGAPEFGPTGSVPAWSSSNIPAKTAPLTSPCGSRATGNAHQQPRCGSPWRGFSFAARSKSRGPGFRASRSALPLAILAPSAAISAAATDGEQEWTTRSFGPPMPGKAAHF